MKEIFIKYNPFTLETKIEMDGENLNEKYNFLFNKKQRLQEWIDIFIEKLDEEINYRSYCITFHGTKLDYDDLTEVIKKLENREIKLKHIISKEITDRKKEIQNIFYEIQNNSYGLENLKSKNLRKRFEEILNSEFEINVIATMSSGKSTLIQIEGDIPFVKANEITLVITDTPGPNNSNDESHKQTLLDMLDSNKYKPLILYVMNATQLGITDDNDLLNNVIAKLQNADKQTRDSFLFVINKVDNFGRDDNLEKTIEKIKKYLEKKGIVEPNIFPVAALPALEIRLKPKNELEKMDRDHYIKRMNLDKNLYLEKYIPLPSKAEKEIKNELINGNQEKTALIHTGIPSLEKIIKTYIEKYAIAIKIKDLTDLFKGLVNDELNTNQLSKQINETNDNSKILKLKEQIKNINDEISDLKKFDDYNKQIRQSSRRVAENLEIKIKKIEKDLSIKVTNCAVGIRMSNPEKVKIEQGKALYAEMIKIGKNIEIKLKNELKNAIQKGLVETLEELYKEYINRLKKLTLTGNKIIDGENLIINPFEMMEGNIESSRSFDEFRSEYSEKKNEVIGTKEVENQREWWEFWRWLESPTKIINVYGDVEYIGINDFTETYVDPIEGKIRDTTSKALEHSKKEIVKIQDQFIKTKEQLDKILRNKLDYISELLQNKGKITEDIKIKSEMYAKKIEWLKNIKNRIENVIEI